MYDRDRAVIETNLGRAHRSVHTAKEAAERQGDDALYLDLQVIETTLTRLAENSLRGKARQQLAGQTSIEDAAPVGSR